MQLMVKVKQKEKDNLLESTPDFSYLQRMVILKLQWKPK